MVTKRNPEQKRVATLYRVSTKGQLDDNDIPMQERSCKKFIEQKGNWILVKEYTEKGVSGFKVSASNRDVIQQAKEDAENGLFDVLLVFMFDRLGRKDDETPFVLEWFVNQGIEMWSVIEGQQKIEQHTDRLVNYLRFWQSSGESRKTSERVDEKHIQMVEDGIFRGGGIPYGYEGIPSGIKNKKGKELLQLVINEEEALVVEKIYHLVYEEGYGQLRIAKLLNEENIPTRKAKKWGASTVNTVLKNPIYKGVMRYRDTRSEQIPELVIVAEEVWNAVQEIRKKRNPKSYSPQDSTVPMNTKGSLLFIGLARCGCCNSRMTSTTFVNKYRDATGEVIKYNHNKSYRCTGKLEGKEICNGQGTFSARKVEGVVLKQIDFYLEHLRRVDFSKEIKKMQEKNSSEEEKRLLKLQAHTKKEESELSVLNGEVPKSLMGNSSFKPALLNQLIEQKEKAISEINKEIIELESAIESKKIEIDEIKALQNYIPDWKAVFKSATTERKKIMLGLIIDKIYISREEVRVELRIKIKQFLENSSCETNHSGRAPHPVSHISKKRVIRDTLTISLK